MRVLVVNPNTTRGMTDKIAAAARSAAAPGTIIDGVTASMGPDSIEGYYDEAFAVPGVIQAMVAGEQAGADGGIVACFDDTGLDAARTAVAMPVVGICESAIHLVAPLAHRFTIVTTLPRSIAPLEALAERYGVARRCRVRAADVPVLALEDRISGAIGRIEQEIAAALDRDGAEAIVLGCAGMADLAAEFTRKFDVPVIEGVAAAVKMTEALAGVRLRTSKVGAYAAPLPKTYRGAMAPFAPKPR